MRCVLLFDWISLETTNEHAGNAITQRSSKTKSGTLQKTSIPSKLQIFPHGNSLQTVWNLKLILGAALSGGPMVEADPVEMYYFKVLRTGGPNG